MKSRERKLDAQPGLRLCCSHASRGPIIFTNSKSDGTVFKSSNGLHFTIV